MPDPRTRDRQYSGRGLLFGPLDQELASWRLSFVSLAASFCFLSSVLETRMVTMDSTDRGRDSTNTM